MNKFMDKYNNFGKALLLLIFLITLLLAIMGITYAYWSMTVVQKEENIITSGCLSLYFDDEGSNSIKFDESNPAYPMTEREAMAKEPYTFTIENRCTTDMHYNITLNASGDSNLDNYLYYSLIDENEVKVGPKILSVLPTYTEYDNFTYTDVENDTTYYIKKSYILDTGNLARRKMNEDNTEIVEAGESKTYSLYLWIDETVEDTATMGKKFEGKIIVTSSTQEMANIYGVKREIDSSLTTWERTNDATGLIANAQLGEITNENSAQNAFDNIYPWSDIKSYNYDTNAKRITAWYGEKGFTFTPEENIEVMTYIPEFYYKREQKDGYEYIYISKEQINGYVKSEAFSVGRYTMSGDESRVHSRSGVTPLVNKNIDQFREYAKNIDMQQLDYHYFILQLLYLVEYADYNSQNILGVGNTNSSGAIQSGECNDLGMKSGTLNNDGTHSVIYRGIENIFGNVWQFVDGINIKNNQTYICYDASKYKSDTFNDEEGEAYNECYKPIGYTNATLDGSITKLGYDTNNQLISLPIAVDGSDSTYIPDYYWQNSGNRIALVGGWWNAGGVVGLWCWACTNGSSDAGTSRGARLLMTS